jgi:ribosomal subunit interface protein
MRLTIHAQGIDLNATLREHIQMRLRTALSRFAPKIGRVDVHLRDENGPRGGVAERCLLRARLGSRNLVVTRTREDIIAAVNDASDRLADAARRALAREHTHQ